MFIDALPRQQFAMFCFYIFFHSTGILRRDRETNYDAVRSERDRVFARDACERQE